MYLQSSLPTICFLEIRTGIAWEFPKFFIRAPKGSPPKIVKFSETQFPVVRKAL